MSTASSVSICLQAWPIDMPSLGVVYRGMTVALRVLGANTIGTSDSYSRPVDGDGTETMVVMFIESTLICRCVCV